MLLVGGSVAGSFGGGGKAVVAIVSDHGFKPVRRQVMPNAAFLNAGLLQASDGTVTSASAYLMSEGGTAFVYLTVPDPDAQLLGRGDPETG